jgi:hypothetical protein
LSEKHSFHKKGDPEDRTDIHLLKDQEFEKLSEVQLAEKHDAELEGQLPAPSTETGHDEGVKNDTKQATGMEDGDEIAP